MIQPTKIFEPGKIGSMSVRNRIVMAPMGTHSADSGGYVTDRMIDYYVERAKGGVGLIITEGIKVLLESGGPYSGNISDDKFIPRFRDLTCAVQAHGARMACQLNLHGAQALEHWSEEMRPEWAEAIGPSAVKAFPYGVIPRALSREEIHYLVEAYAEGARRAKDAGFDAVEIHGCHGYFLGAFQSPFKNRRTDEYGGSLENRTRFACEVIRLVRKKVGPEFPISFRMNGSDFFEGGVTLNDAMQQAPLLVEAGANALHISAAAPESHRWRDLCYLYPDGAIVHLAEAIKKVVNIPVITVGKIGNLAFADRILREGRADFVAMGRALLADPELPKKSKEGRLEDIHRCIYCNNCRVSRLGREKILVHGEEGPSCTVNPALLREKEFTLKPTEHAKNVMVIGGGLAGMEATRVLAERGHRVSLYERSDQLGGQWNVACMLESKSEFASVTQNLTRGLDKCRAKVILNTEVTPTLVRKVKPDVVVVATGATPKTLGVPGAEGKNVVKAEDVIQKKVQVGQRVVVVGGRLVGMEIAESLAKQGKKVSLVTKNGLGENGVPLERNIFVTLRDRLYEIGVLLLPYSPVFEILEKGIYVIDRKELMFLEADTVVMAVGMEPENYLVEELKAIVPQVYAIGDCVSPRNAKEAINDGAEIGREI
ncbi:MAG: FAD-dependent oxidoreductase [Thermodesulfobacteriota bacterium]|nr:FAD-dependent oxidoreductase [Thermodesulfobacteriota bacterium]